MSFETISVVGLGYIGLPTAAMFASRKKKVIGVDVNKYAVDTINQGKIHIIEPELDMIVHAAVTEKYLKATSMPEPADAFLIAVPTPFKPCGKGDIPEPDLSFIKAATEAIAPVLKKGDLIILESTSPVGATEQMAGWLAEYRTDLSFPQQVGESADVNIAHCPERVLPGHVVRELVENDRVIGGMTDKCSDRAVKLYQTFVEGECIVTNARTAEMAKLTENSFRDVNIAFANELSLICEELDINVWELIKLANRHPRVNILQPGPGVGGHCIAVDPWFIVSKTPDLAKVIYNARMVNDSKPDWVVEKVKAACFDKANQDDKRPSELTVACLGLAFKPDIDDLRESPALDIAKRLKSELSGNVIYCEPNISCLPNGLDEEELCTMDQAIAKADVVVLLVAHSTFKNIEVNNLVDKKLIDVCGMWWNKEVI